MQFLFIVCSLVILISSFYICFVLLCQPVDYFYVSRQVFRSSYHFLCIGGAINHCSRLTCIIHSCVSTSIKYQCFALSCRLRRNPRLRLSHQPWKLCPHHPYGNSLRPLLQQLLLLITKVTILHQLPLRLVHMVIRKRTINPRKRCAVLTIIET